MQHFHRFPVIEYYARGVIYEVDDKIIEACGRTIPGVH